MWVHLKYPETKESLEANNLPLHTTLQKEREARVDRQIAELRERLNAFEEKEHERKSFVFKTVVGAVVSSITSIIFLIIGYVKQ